MTDPHEMYRLQAAHYAKAYLLASENEPSDEVKAQAMRPKALGNYSEADLQYTLNWYHHFGGLAIQPLVNRLRPKHNQLITSLNDLIRPSTIEQMARPLRQSTPRPWRHLHW